MRTLHRALAVRRVATVKRPMKPASGPDFAALVRRRFAYLETEYAFSFQCVDSGYVRFDQPELEINLLWGRGELDTFFQVRREDAVFRPYKSRQFLLHEVVKTIAPSAYDDQPESSCYVQTLEEVDRHLQRDAALLQTHCAPILNGDFSVLESIYRDRET